MTPLISHTSNCRQWLRAGLRGAAAAGLVALAGRLLLRSPRAQTAETLWQIDPERCIACGQCATHCVLDKSAVVCKHNFAMCGYCDLCTGYFEPQPLGLNSGAENQLCPTGAIQRRFVEDPYFEYTIEEPLCIGCGKCVKGCHAFGNGSLYLQVDHDRCANCNECAIARDCPSEAFFRTSLDEPYREPLA